MSNTDTQHTLAAPVMGTPAMMQHAFARVVKDPIADALTSLTAQGVTPANVEALAKLADIYERMQLKEAEKAFNAAFVALQADLPVIVASTPIPNRGKYERFEDVMATVGPLLKRHGFSVAFSMSAAENRVTETCTLRHAGGHCSSNSFSVRTSSKADSETQADCKAATTAKRNALLNCLNVVIRQDALQSEEDPRNDGAPIDFAQAQTLREMVRDTGSDEAAFLRFAGSDKYETIGGNRYQELFALLNRKAAKK